MKKKLTAALAATLCVANLGLTVTACNKPVEDDANTLEIFTVFAGYGTEWLEEEAKAFAQEAWVKEKYPELTVEVKNNVVQTMAVDKISAGGKANTADLLFTTQPEGSQYNKKDSAGNYYFEDLKDVYNSEVPGEGVKYVEKLNQDLLPEYEVELLSGEEVKFAVPWVNGSSGMFVNETYLENALGTYELPRTTYELVQLCEDLKAKGKPAFVTAMNEGYGGFLFTTWWAQYEGYQAVDNYMNGLDALGNYTANIAKAEGRLLALERMKDIFWRSNGYIFDGTFDSDYTEAQRSFLTGKAAMMPNGDWLECEMKTAGTTTTDKISQMKTPVTLDIVKKLSIWTDGKAKVADLSADKKEAYNTILSGAIEAIDGGATTYTGLTDADMAKLIEARALVNRLGSHNAFIPSYATAKDAAKDFLRFLATDKAIKIMMDYTGSISPFTYDAETKDPDFYNSLSYTQKTRIERMKNSKMMRPVTSYPLCYLGSLYSLTVNKNVEASYMKQAEDQRETPQQIFNLNAQDIEGKYESMLRNAGLK